MIESIALFIKSLPTWLAHVTEILIVAVIFMTCMTFLAGIWVGLRIIGKRMDSITEIQFFPPKITMKVKEHDEEEV